MLLNDRVMAPPVNDENTFDASLNKNMTSNKKSSRSI